MSAISARIGANISLAAGLPLVMRLAAFRTFNALCLDALDLLSRALMA